MEGIVNVESDLKQSMEGAIEHFKKELKTLRTGRANPAVVDSVYVEVYGTAMRLKDVANVTVPEARQILITPYDGNNAGAIGKAIDQANIGLQSVVDGNVVRINVPPMDESIRKDIVKTCKKKTEEAKVAIREVRRKFNDLVRKQKADGDIAEDQMKGLEKKIQDMTDKSCKEADTLCTEKEKEILAI